MKTIKNTGRKKGGITKIKDGDQEVETLEEKTEEIHRTIEETLLKVTTEIDPHRDTITKVDQLPEDDTKTTKIKIPL